MNSVGRAYLLCLLLFLLAAPASRAQTISLSTAQIDRLRALVKSDDEAGARLASLKAEADDALKDKPNPAQKILSQGRLKTDPAKIRTAKSLADMEKLDALGWTHAVTGEARYADKAREFILAWARQNEPSGDPIDETKLAPLLVAYDLTRKVFSNEENLAVHQWLRKIAEAEVEHEKKSKSTAFNNWNSHRLKIIGLIGYVLADQSLIRRATEGYRKQIAENLRPDGSSFDFHERDALHYHCYDLEPLLLLAVAARLNGADLYHYKAASGASLGKSVQFLVPYCTGAKTHAEFTHSKVAFDKKRASAGEKAFETGHLFEPRHGAPVLELAAFFDPSFEPVYFKARGKTPSKFASWQLVLNVARQ